MRKEEIKIDPKKPFFDNGAPPVFYCQEHQVAYYKSPRSLSGVMLPCCEIERYIAQKKIESEIKEIR